MSRINDLKRQIEHLKKHHLQADGGRAWLNELEGKLWCLEHNIQKKEVYKPVHVSVPTHLVRVQK